MNTNTNTNTNTTTIMLTAPLSGSVGVVGVLRLWNKYHFDAFLQTSLILYLHSFIHLYIYVDICVFFKASDVTKHDCPLQYSVLQCNLVSWIYEALAQRRHGKWSETIHSGKLLVFLGSAYFDIIKV